MLFNRDSTIQSVFPKDSAQSTSQKIQFPARHLDDVIYRPDDRVYIASSIWTTRTFRLNLPLCREASNYSSLHPFGHFSSPSRRLSVFDQASVFLSKHRYGKIAATVWTTWIPIRTRSSIRQVNPDVRTAVIMVRTHVNRM
jgi:hypothetical protein